MLPREGASINEKEGKGGGGGRKEVGERSDVQSQTVSPFLVELGDLALKIA